MEYTEQEKVILKLALRMYLDSLSSFSHKDRWLAEVASELLNNIKLN